MDVPRKKQIKTILDPPVNKNFNQTMPSNQSIIKKPTIDKTSMKNNNISQQIKVSESKTKSYLHDYNINHKPTEK